MGLQKREGGGGGTALFYKINAKEGCIQTTVKNAETGANDKVKERPGDATLTGTVVKAEVVKDEYQSAVNYILRLKLVDPEPGQPNMFVDLPFGSEANGASMFGLQVMGRLNAANLDRPLSFTPWFIPKGHTNPKTKEVSQKDRSGCVVMQDGVKIVEDYGDGVSQLPALPIVKVGPKDVQDKSPWDNLANQLYETLVARLTPPAGEAHAPDDIDPDEVAGAAQSKPGFGPRG